MSDNAYRKSIYLIVPEDVEKLWIMLMDLIENQAGQTSAPGQWVWVGALFPYAKHIEALAERGEQVARERCVLMRPWTDGNIATSLGRMVNQYSLASVRHVPVDSDVNVEVCPRPLADHALYTISAAGTQLYFGNNARAQIASPKSASPIITHLRTENP